MIGRAALSKYGRQKSNFLSVERSEQSVWSVRVAPHFSFGTVPLESRTHMKIHHIGLPVITAFVLWSAPLAHASGVEVWISDRTPACTTCAGTPDDPYRCPDGTSLQTVLASVGQNSTIHFLPGLFLVIDQIDPKVGWKLRGSGIDNTTLKLLPRITTPGGGGVAVIGGIYGYYAKEGVEVSDMTVDCNLQGQTNAMAVCAVHIAGNNTRISRVHAINWGSILQGTECFVLNIASHSAIGPRTNCVIEGCVVDTPAPVTHADGTTAVSIFTGWEEDPGYPLVIGGEISGNLVTGITAGGGGIGRPSYLNAYGLGAFQGYVHDNRAINLVGGVGFYQDTWSGSDVIVAHNVFDNVSSGVYFYTAEEHMQRIKILGNVIMPSENGVGITYYTGEPNNANPNAFTRNLIIKDNTVHPCRLATNLSSALALNGDITATVVNNILDAGTTGTDVRVAWWQLPRLKLNTFAGNFNLKGTVLELGANSEMNWRPGYEDIIRFTPQTNATGWYRIASGNGFCSGVAEVYDPIQWGDVALTDLEFSWRVAWGTSDPNNLGDINVIRQGSYQKYGTSNGGIVTKARIGSNHPTDPLTYLDIYVSKAQDPKEITVKVRGLDRGMLYKSPQLITQPPPNTKELSF